MANTRNTRLAHSMVIASIALCISLSLDFLGGSQRLEWISYDWRMKTLREDVRAPDDIAIILIDETSLANMNPLVGRWPWPRTIHADVLDFIASGEPKAIIVDILFTEHDSTANDKRLAEASMSGRTYHAAQLITDTQDEHHFAVPLDQKLPNETLRFTLDFNTLSVMPTTLYNTYSFPYDELIEASHGLGIVSISADADGIYRRIPLLHRYQDHIFPGLSLAPLTNELQLASLNPDAQLINYYGYFNTYSMSGITASAQSLLSGDVENMMIDPYEFENKIVYIGASAAGVQDLKATPLSQQMPGVMIHASMTGNLMNNDLLQAPNNTYNTLLCIILAVLTSILCIHSKRLITKIMVPVIFSALIIASGFYLFTLNTVVTMITPLMTTTLTAIVCFIYLMSTEGRDKRRIRAMLAQYVSPAVLTEVVDNYEDHLHAEIGREECLSVLFSDIRGFTNLSEAVPPAQLVETLNFYFSNMTDAIFEHEGTIDKFIGDAIMAFWGAPIKDAAHAKKAVYAAIEMTKRLQQVNQWLADKAYPQINIGIGINTGNVIIGNIGSDRKLDYTVIGDNVNLASRLEGLTKPYGCSIIFAESTYAQLDHELPCSVIDIVRVKGKSKPIRIYTPIIDTDTNDAENIAQQINKAFDLYLNQEWQQAISAYQAISNTILRDEFILRCNNFMKNPPPDNWDGVHTMTSK